MKNRRWHFVIHNQGEYDEQAKMNLLRIIKAKWKNCEAYLIAQEMYKHEPNDSHLQGNLFFKEAIHKTALLKELQKHYLEVRTEQGLKGRIDISLIEHQGRAYNYMINPSKEGGDPNPLTNMEATAPPKPSPFRQFPFPDEPRNPANAAALLDYLEASIKYNDYQDRLKIRDAENI